MSCGLWQELGSILFLKSRENSRGYYIAVLPNLTMPQLIYAEDYLPEEEFADVKHVPLSMDRGKELALATIITGSY